MPHINSIESLCDYATVVTSWSEGHNASLLGGWVVGETKCSDMGF